MKKITFFIVFALLFGAVKAQSFLDSVTTTSNGQFCPLGGTITFNIYYRTLGGPSPDLVFDNFLNVTYSGPAVSTFTTVTLDVADAGPIQFDLKVAGVTVGSKTVTITAITSTAGTVSSPFSRDTICLFSGFALFIDSGASSTGSVNHIWQYYIAGGSPTRVTATSDTLSIPIDYGTTAPSWIKAQMIDTAVCPTGGSVSTSTNLDSFYLYAPPSNRLDSINDSTIQLHFATGGGNIRYLPIKDGVPQIAKFGNLGVVTFAATPGTYFVEISDTITGCKRFTDTITFGAGIPLPIVLKSFEASSANGTVELSWSTYTETNNAKFEVLRFNGESFETFGVVGGAGNSRNIRKYSFTDQKPLIGIGYYRLRQVDFDGHSTMSDIITVEVVSSDPSWKIEGGMLSAIGKITVRNMSGIIVLTGKDQVSIESLAPGAYIFLVNDKSQKVVLQ